MTHVHTVYCPSCKRMWTGEFNEPVPEQAVCRDCIREGEGTTNDHKDVHINKQAR